MAQVNPEIALPVQIVIRIVWARDVQLTQFHEAANPLPLRRWTVIDLSATTDASEPVCGPSFEAPFGVDLRVNFDWKVSGRVTFFAEGRNLVNRRLYEYPWYPELGANFTVGVKANF